MGFAVTQAPKRLATCRKGRLSCARRSVKEKQKKNGQPSTNCKVNVGGRRLGGNADKSNQTCGILATGTGGTCGGRDYETQDDASFDSRGGMNRTRGKAPQGHPLCSAKTAKTPQWARIWSGVAPTQGCRVSCLIGKVAQLNG